MSELALPTVVSDTVWQPSSRINFLDGTLDGGLDVVKCTYRVAFLQSVFESWNNVPKVLSCVLAYWLLCQKRSVLGSTEYPNFSKNLQYWRHFDPCRPYPYRPYCVYPNIGRTCVPPPCPPCDYTLVQAWTEFLRSPIRHTVPDVFRRLLSSSSQIVLHLYCNTRFEFSRKKFCLSEHTFAT